MKLLLISALYVAVWLAACMGTALAAGAWLRRLRTRRHWLQLYGGPRVQHGHYKRWWWRAQTTNNFKISAWV